jgi:hypothetical protein
MTYVMVGLAGAFVAQNAKRTQDIARNPASVRGSVAEWTALAEQLADTVPPRLLLGADGRSAALEKALAAKGMSRSEFRKAADIVIKVVGPCSDESAREALAVSFSDFPLPEGIDVPSATFPERVARTPAVEAARVLVLELTARLATSVSSPEDS